MNLIAAGPSLDQNWGSQLGGAPMQSQLTNNSLLGQYTGANNTAGYYNVPSSSGLTLNPLGNSLDALALKHAAAGGMLQNKMPSHVSQLPAGMQLHSNSGLGLPNALHHGVPQASFQNGFQNGLQNGLQNGVQSGLQNRYLHAAEQLAVLQQAQKNAAAAQMLNPGFSMPRSQALMQAPNFAMSQPMMQSQMLLNGLSAQAPGAVQQNRFLNSVGQPVLQNSNTAAAYYLLQNSSAAAASNHAQSQLHNILAGHALSGQHSGLNEAAVAAVAAAQAQQRANELSRTAHLAASNAALAQYLQAQQQNTPQAQAQLNNMAWNQHFSQMSMADANAGLLLNQAAKHPGAGFQGLSNYHSGALAANNAALQNLYNMQGASLSGANHAAQVDLAAALQAAAYNRANGHLPSGGGNAATGNLAQIQAAAAIQASAVAAAAAQAAAAAVTSAQAAAAQQSAPFSAFHGAMRPTGANQASLASTGSLNAAALNGMANGIANGMAAARHNNYLATALLHGLVPPSAAFPSSSGNAAIMLPIGSEPFSARSNSFDVAVAAPIHLNGAANMAVGSRPLGPIGPSDSPMSKHPSVQLLPSVGSGAIPSSTPPTSQASPEVATSAASTLSGAPVAGTMLESKNFSASSDAERYAMLKELGVQLAQSNVTVEHAIQMGLLGGLGASDVQVLLSAREAAAAGCETGKTDDVLAANSATVLGNAVPAAAEGVDAASFALATVPGAVDESKVQELETKVVDNGKDGGKEGGKSSQVEEEVVILDGKFDAFSYQFFGEDVELVCLQELEDSLALEGNNDVTAEPNRLDGSVLGVGVGEVNETVQESGERGEAVVADRLANLDLGSGFC